VKKLHGLPYRVVPALYLAMQLIAMGAFWQSSDYAQLVHTAPAGMHVLGGFLFAGAVFFLAADIKDTNYVTQNEAVNKLIEFALAALSLWAYTGFQS
jgi:hypothetical protein